MAQTELAYFQSIDEVLIYLKNTLHDQYRTTNKRINKKQNPYLKFNAKNEIVLSTPKVDKINQQSVSVLFSDAKYTSILQVLSDVNHVTDYLSCLTHYSVKDKKIMPRKESFYYEDKGYKIIPERYINEELIKTHWEDILRLMVTIKLKENTASQIFKRLSSYSRQHPLYCAMKEFGRIIKSIFILRYMDEVGLRQAIEKQLNRVELSNKFSKAIMFGSNQEIQYSGKEEQEIAVSCQRFIQNAIILWNELYLSQKLHTEKDINKRKTMLEIIRHGSTMLWGHLNLHGEYDFTQDIAANDFQFDIEKILTLKVA